MREVKEETGIDVGITKKMGSHQEQGAQPGIENDYFPTCFLAKVLVGEIRRKEREIEEIRSFGISLIPNSLAFEHNQIIGDYLRVIKISKRMQ